MIGGLRGDPKMHLRNIYNGAAFLFIGAVALFAADSPFVGTWKLNAAQSKLEGSGMGQATVRIESDSNGLKGSVEGADPQGQPITYSYQLPLDGTDGTFTGNANVDAVSAKRVNDNTLNVTGKKSGNVVWTDRRVVSSDGKTMTLTRDGTNPQGQKYHAVAVFDKQ